MSAARNADFGVVRNLSDRVEDRLKPSCLGYAKGADGKWVPTFHRSEVHEPDDVCGTIKLVVTMDDYDGVTNI